ncbi:hypothetical protein E4Q23_22985 [Candidatus Accumulibacter phosphatis]|uniref:Uncharacterized protein n=1 Tax=Candidatus Accumulibacter phosphatis TaxID=327160 RepID=A0ABX1U1G3_9PROT|nr:hypothetical protein [Candidatus Accumulibacter phosphatis]NMQ30371.1 hypothetical protein [Candidatus Accumulibacter phosphatis]
MATLLGKKAWPVRVEHQQVARKKLPVFLGLEQSLFAKANHFARGVKHILSLCRDYANPLAIRVGAISRELWGDIDPEPQQMAPGFRLGRVRRLQHLQYMGLVDLLDHSPVDELFLMGFGNVIR